MIADFANENERLKLENEELKLKLQESQELIEAIQSGAIDALVIKGETGNDIYTLKSADHTYRVLVEEMNEGAITVSKEGRILYCNIKFSEFTGLALDEIIGASFHDFITFENHSALDALLSEGWNGSSKGEIILQRRHNQPLPVLLSVKALLFNENTPMLGIVLTDLSDQKEIIEHIHARQLLEESENRFKTVIENAPLIFWSLDKDGIFTTSQGKGLLSLGLKPGELVGKRHTELYKNYPGASAPITEAYKGNAVVKEVYVQGRWFETFYNPLIDKNKEINGIVAISTDITDRKLAEEEVKKSEERFRVMADNIPNLAFMTEADGWVFWYNKRWYEYTGTSESQMKGWGWQSVHDPHKVAEVTETWQNSINGGEPFEMIFPLKGSDGLFRPFLTRIVPVKDKNGKIIRWFGTSTDITERINTEEDLEIKNQELLKINNDLDNFVYTASHDLKAPISNLEGLLYALKKNIEKNEIPSSTINPIIGLMEKSISRFQETIKGLTEISKVQKNLNEDIDTINLDQLVEEVKLEINDLIIKGGAEIDVDTKQIPVLRLSKLNLKSIIQNLLTNAIKYRHPDRIPTIVLTTYLESSYSVIEVRDNGLGIPVEGRTRIFEMFKRVHSHVEGSGIGLYIVKRIVNNAGGKIKVESALGEGSTFKVYLPA